MLTAARIAQLERLGARVTAPLPDNLLKSILVNKRRRKLRLKRMKEKSQ